jgi:hypothetical protein
MSKKDDDLFPADEDETEALEEFDRLSMLLFERINAFAQEEDVADDILPLLLLRASATLRMTGYVMTVAKPSAGGLKLDLDRFRRQADDLVREMKKDAERFVVESGKRLAEMELDDDEHEK